MAKLWLPDTDKRLMGFICRHIVAIAGTYVTVEQAASEFFCYTGFVIDVGGHVVVVTAGHCIEEWRGLHTNPKVQVTSSVLVDYFGNRATAGIPQVLAFDQNKSVYVHNKHYGIDFGLLLLPHYQLDALRQNGVSPFVCDERRGRAWNNYEAFGILGFPKDENRHVASMQGNVSAVKPVLATITLDEQKIRETWNDKPRFVGTLPDSTNPDGIKGLSGGPILGFVRNGENLDYWVVAIQSSVGGKSVYGCPLSVMFRILGETLRHRQRSEQE